MRRTIAVLNGPNLNLLGQRQPAGYEFAIRHLAALDARTAGTEEVCREYA